MQCLNGAGVFNRKRQFSHAFAVLPGESEVLLIRNATTWKYVGGKEISTLLYILADGILSCYNFIVIY